MATTQLKDKDGINIYPAIESEGQGGSDGGNTDIDLTTDVVYNREDCTIADKYVNYQGGLSTSTALKCSASDYLPVVGDSMTVKYEAADVGGALFYAFYDSNKALISGKVFPCNSAVSASVEHDFTSWATQPKYVRFTASKTEYGAMPNMIPMQFKAVQQASGGEAVKAELDKLKKGKKGTYQILWFGNSFSECTYTYFNQICYNLGVYDVRLQAYRVANGTLQYYSSMIESDTVVEGTGSGAGSFVTKIDYVDRYSSAKMTDILNHPWDAIVFQQRSGDSDAYSTFEPYLGNLVDAVKTYCPNKFVKLYWYMTWECDKGSTQNNIDASYADIVATVKKMLASYPQFTVIPSGTAIQNVRSTTLNDAENANNFSYDGEGVSFHLAGGVGNYTAGCCFYEKVIAPITGKSIIYDTLTTASSESLGNVAVTDDNRFICHHCALAAIEKPFETTDPSLLDPNYESQTS